MKRTTPNLFAGLLLGTLAVAAMSQAAGQEYTFTTLAGPAESPGALDGPGSAARFFFPVGLAADAAGNLFVTDDGNHTIRKVTPVGRRRPWRAWREVMAAPTAREVRRGSTAPLAWRWTRRAMSM